MKNTIKLFFFVLISLSAALPYNLQAQSTIDDDGDKPNRWFEKVREKAKKNRDYQLLRKEIQRDSFTDTLTVNRLENAIIIFHGLEEREAENFINRGIAELIRMEALGIPTNWGTRDSLPWFKAPNMEGNEYRIFRRIGTYFREGTPTNPRDAVAKEESRHSGGHYRSRNRLYGQR